MLTKSQLKELFDERGFRPLKALGENYLIDENIKDKIIEKAHILRGDAVLEIGPGLGALTIDLALRGANVYAVEKDKKAYNMLSDIVREKFPNLKLLHQDVLKFDLKNIYSSKKIKVLGCLPYYVTTPIIKYLIENKSLIEFILITVQREFAERLLANPGTRDYGSISCFVQYHTRPSYIHTVRRSSFYPAPKVDSSLIRLDVLSEPPVALKDDALFFKIIRGAFNQRRKSIVNSLSRKEVLGISKEKLSSTLNDIGIEPKTRPESLSLSDFANITNGVKPILPPAG